MDPKTQWRQTLLAKRRDLTEDFVREASQAIATKLFGLEEYNLAERFGLYAAFQKEVLTEAIFSKSHAQRKEIYYPAVDAKKKEVFFYRVHSLRELQPGFASILEPPKGRHPLTNINYLNMLVVPGVVFDKKGNRIGLGQGYYDRLLAKFQGTKVALAYEFQIVEELPATQRDERVDILVTEERILKRI